MKWTYQELMDTPADVYEVLITWLGETPPTIVD